MTFSARCENVGSGEWLTCAVQPQASAAVPRAKPPPIALFVLMLGIR